MKSIIQFSKFYLPAAVFSLAVIAAGAAGFFLQGFNLGVDFKGGLIQEVQFAPTAFRLTYSGNGNASISMSRSSLTIVISGAGAEEQQYDFPFSEYQTMADLLRGLSEINGISSDPDPAAQNSIRSSWLIQSAQSSPVLGAEPLIIHYLSPEERPIPIEDVRSSLLPLGTVSVQVLGDPQERHFMIRMDDSGDGQGIPAETIVRTLEGTFGRGGVVVTRSDFVGSRISRQLTGQVGILTFFTVLLILAYSAIRFKLYYAVSAVLAIVHDGLVMATFIIWTRMEFNTTTIAAILTILGYSINDTVVVFDRMRETRHNYPDDDSTTVLNRSLTGTMSRTIFTTVTTMLAVISLFIFTTGSMKDFALALLVGLVSGVYSTIFIASGMVNFWETRKERKKKKAHAAAEAGTAVPAKA